MNKNIIWGGLVLTLSVFFLSGCNKSKNEETINPKQTQQKSAFLDDYLKSDWLNILPDQKWDNIQKTDDSYYYEYKEEIQNDAGINKSVQYKKTDTGDYQGIMKIALSKKSDSFTINVPKDFASHVDQLNFSVEPKEVINPDPIVEFDGTNEEITLTSKENKSEKEIKTSLENQIIDAESERCEKLEGNEAIACSLSLISKYKNSDYIKDELKNLNMAEFLGGVSQAVLQGDMKTCDHINDRNDRSSCYEYAYQILIKDCNLKSGLEYRTCVRDLSSKLPSYKEQRLFCGYIKDDDMRAECQGTAPMEICDEIKNEEQKNLCKINIVRINNNTDDCEKIDDDLYRQVCIGIVGTGLNDTSYCDKMEEPYLNGLCRTKIAMQINDKNVCMQIKDLDAKDICLGGFLTKEEAISQEMCNEFHELFLRETCELALAVINNDQNKCADSSRISLDNQSICYFGIAIKHGDLSACEKIQSFNEYNQDATQKLKENCLNIGQKIQDGKQENNQEQKEQPKTEETKSINCSEVSPAICPMDNENNNGATIHLEDDEHDVQCTYYKSKGDGYPLYNEMYKIDKTRDGSYKQYYKDGNIQVFSEHTDGKSDGFRLECTESGDLKNCMYYQPGSKTINCMP